MKTPGTTQLARALSVSHLVATVLPSLIVGIAVWLWAGIRGEDHLPQGIALAAAAILALIAPVRRRLTELLDRIRAASPAQFRLMTAGVFVATVTYLPITSYWQGRDLFPKWHDQQMTLIQTQMLARGRLWMPQHPCADFFETFYVFVKPVYAAMYFPGAALFYVPTVWLHLPYWFMPLLASGALAALMFRVFCEILDPVAGLAAVFLLVSLWIFRLLSVWVMSHTVFTLLALWAVWSWLRWRGGGGSRWALSLGAALGWAAITRPLDAILYGVPLGLAVLSDLRRRPPRQWAITLGSAISAALPFLSLQLVLDKGLTGHWLRSPMQHYTDLEFTGLSAFGGSGNPNAHATSKLEQKKLFGDRLVVPLHRDYLNSSFLQKLKDRIRMTITASFSDSPWSMGSGSLLIILLPVGLLGLRDVRRIVLFAPAVLFVIAYTQYAELLPHYCMTIVPAVLLCVLISIDVVGNVSRAAKRGITAALTLGLILFSIASLPEFHPDRPDDNSWPATWFNYTVLPTQVATPALVLYRYEPRVYADGTENFHDEPVYNVDVAGPDDAPIIRAHDLGARDAEIISYYAKTQPDRNVYVVDRGELPEPKAHFLGKAVELKK